MLARPLTEVKDLTTGFFMFSRDVFPKGTINVDGFKIGLEILVKGNHKKASEFPIVFNDRKYGESKLSSKIMFNA